MSFLLELRKRIKIAPYLESAGVLALYYIVGFFINSKDPFFINHEGHFLSLILGLITLFHGLECGLFSLCIIAGIVKFSYENFLLKSLLYELVLVLLYGEFHYYWKRRIKRVKNELSYVKRKLSELGTSFYFLKISHDQLEKVYVTKPMSLRNSVKEITKIGFEDRKEAFASFLVLLNKAYSLKKGVICSVKDNRAKLMVKNRDATFNKYDLMIETCIKQKQPVYISTEVEMNTDYLAVIPALNGADVAGLLIVEDMPFMDFNKDNLITMSILTEYFFFEMNKVEVLKNMGAALKGFSDDFRFEVYRLFSIFDKYNVSSTVLILKTEEKLMFHLLKDKLDQSLRFLDIYSYMEKDSFFSVAILFPLADKASVEGFLNRFKSLFSNDELKSFVYSSFNIGSEDLIVEYAGKF